MEMNTHLAQSVQARNELKYIASVQYQIVSVKDSSPIIGCQQDTLTGAYMLTQPDVKIKGSDLANILCNTSSETKFEIEMDKYYNGHEIFSHIIPEGINSVKKSGDKITFQILNGKLVTGFLDKSQLSFAKNSIIHFIWDKSGPNKTRRFIDDSQKLVLNYLLMRGQTVGFKDGLVSPEIKEKIQQIITNKILESKYNITQLENDIDPLPLDVIEDTITSDLNTVQAMAGKILMDYYKIDNFFWAGATSGGKGNASNVAQIAGLVGQINLDGSRPRKIINGRALPYFHSYDDTPEARGFAVNNYMSGLSGLELFHNASACRNGLIDTAIKSVTWETPIVVIENNKPVYTEIGKWIDEKMNTNKSNIEYHKDRNMELLETNNIHIPTMNEKGVVTWGQVKAVTRHDPSNLLYKIKTDSGRSVTVVESKSLLVWRDSKFIETLTPEIKIGDMLPTTSNLIEPPVINNYIDVSNYLPKSKYLYGSDYNLAVKMMNEAMGSSFHIKSGWWAQNNNNVFTVPYISKAALQRCYKNSNQENICDGFVYPYGAKRTCAKIPDKFLLNEENGIMVGLYLSEGYISNSAVRITNNNENIQNFIRKWFDKHNINYDEEHKINNIGGTSHTIRGFSEILSLLFEFL
jgi:hypothetical protein